MNLRISDHEYQRSLIILDFKFKIWHEEEIYYEIQINI